MAASALPSPGTLYGPCLEECKHTDCAATREMAATRCVVCGEAIGYDRRFFREENDFLMHMGCWQQERAS